MTNDKNLPEKMEKMLAELFPEGAGQVDKADVNQLAEIKQQILGAGANKANVIMVGSIVIAPSADVEEMLLTLSRRMSQTLGADPHQGIREALGEILRMLPEPRLANLNSLARSIAHDICNGNRTEAAEFLGISVRTLRNHANEDEDVTDISSTSLSGPETDR